MSLYNALFGVNPAAGLALAALGIEQSSVPRFRDAFITEDGKIALYTRTGGGNRDAYERGGSDQEEWNPSGPFNDDLRALVGFINDEDDDFDCTYATFYFEPSSEWTGIIKTLSEVSGAPETASDRWAKLLDDMRADGGPKSDAGKRALQVGEAIVGALKDGGVA